MVEIPLKNVRVTQVIKPWATSIVLKIKDITYIGTEYLLIREDIAPKSFINGINKLENQKAVRGDIFKNNTEADYYTCSDGDIEDYRLTDDGKVIVLKSYLGQLGINYFYYCYLKRLGIELRFNGLLQPIGMFKNNEFVGILFPIRIVR